MKKHYLLLGAHVSSAGGIYQVFKRGEEIGCTALQIFTKSNRRWLANPLNHEEIERFKGAQKNSTIKALVAHAGYLLNIASPDKEIYTKSKQALQDELTRAQQLGIQTLVIHPGARREMPLDQALNQVAQTCDEVFDEVPGTTRIALETMAGQGSSVGGNLEHLLSIIGKIRNRHRIGVCVDTCHIFVAGYDIRTQETYQEFWHLFDQSIGLDKLYVIHLNDSKKELGSKIDRHEFITHGTIGQEAFRLLMNDERLFDVPKILETPVSNLWQYRDDLDVLKNLLNEQTKKKLIL